MPDILDWVLQKIKSLLTEENFEEVAKLAVAEDIRPLLTRELQDELDREVETTELRKGLVRLQLPHRGPVAYVAAVDPLSIMLTGDSAQTEEEVASELSSRMGGEFPLGQVSLAVVDEGHHVFGWQEVKDLEGQRRFEVR